MIKNCMYMMKRIWRYSKMRVILIFVVAIICGLNTFVDVMFYKYLIDGVTAHKPFSYMLIVLAIRIVVLLIYQGIENLTSEVLYPLYELKIAQGLSLELYEKVKNIDISSVDDSEFYDKYSRAISEIDHRSKAVLYTLSYICETICQVLLVGISLVYINPIVIAIAIAGAGVTMAANVHKAKLGFDFNQKRTRFWRGFSYIERVFYIPQYAKDIRTTHVNQILYQKYNELVEENGKLIRDNAPKIALTKIIAECSLFILGTGATSVVMLYEVYQGVIGLGDFVTGNYAVSNFTSCLLGFADVIPQMTENSLFIQNYIEVIEYQSKIQVDEDAIAVNPRISNEIELKNVYYKYPNVDKNALHDINLSIKSGEKIGLVGENGAGKSTLLKLIIRLYDPASGELRLNNRPYRKITLDSLKDSFAIVEQDFQHYAFSIREDVSLEKDASEEKVYEALKKVNLVDAVDSLPQKADSQLTNEFAEDGINLSGGQLQRLAIARMIYQDAGILIMDEPSSALDPISEAKMFEIIYKLAADKTLILVSHRLSGVKDMDRILFMEDGSIVESGTHEELMEQNGKYASMFKIQAERYGVNLDKGDEKDDNARDGEEG